MHGTIAPGSCPWVGLGVKIYNRSPRKHTKMWLKISLWYHWWGWRLKIKHNNYTEEICLVVDEKASFRPLILDQGGASGWGQRKCKSIQYVISRELFRSQPLNLCIVVLYDEMHSMSHTLRPLGSCPALSCPFHFIKSQISQKLFRSPPLNHIYYFSLW